ncbi:bifunctional NAD(P)H-hydrate repair enzyme Nnr [Clostridium acetireducens DSM 10703]|uniref:Bifunctional NAD(P)H-hydrate repair enzyme n=1 Tax=Clostridium acetireducens DSM 10703 TaxID=1121290 RepID=A0A1E8F2F4_9CLOT|nr:bifunctional ADP-dependent NAD(P)H-hydrate dehydratase/NAD(P)H-hydrate epimerase [Clostridium acetireducens]OFI07511.1 bifunctional NAD(P)H-hydrate repair enzyme Nnr [Clostridium acetireducens DSM 10703]
MKIISSSSMKNIDSFCINNLGIPGCVLMENAALKVIKNLELSKYNSFTIICGKGNNGGDGFAIARHLSVLGKSIKVFVIGDISKLKGDSKVNYKILQNMDMDIKNINSNEDIKTLKEEILKTEVIIDAIFGTGLSRNVEGIYDVIISTINEYSKFVVSVDVPSGINSDTGEILGNSVKADKTISFQLYKKGFLNFNSKDFFGEIIVENIGIPEFIIDAFYENEFLMDKYFIKNNIKVRNKYSHKGDFGKVSIVAGSDGFTGAAYISTQSAVRSGAGLVTLCCKKSIQNILSEKLEEAMTASYEDKDRFIEIIKKSNSIAIGPGMGNNENTFNILKCVITNSNCPLVIDADGINVLSKGISILENKKNHIVITPHLGEMARICNLDIEYIKNNKIKVAKDFAKEHDIIVLLKGYNTIITDGKSVFVNTTGNSAMASGGMGDCLTGIIASFIAQGYSALKSAYLGAYIHGYCGDILSKKMFCVNANHIINYIPFVIKNIENNF